MSRIGKTALLAMLVATAAGAESRYEVRYTRDLAYRSGKISVEHAFGDVEVRGGSSQTVEVRALIRSSDPAFGKQIRVVAEEGAGGIVIRTEYPKTHVSRDGKFSFSVDAEITVPRQAPVAVRNRFGNVEASHLSGANQFVNAHGSLHVHDTEGTQTLENQFGSIEVSDGDGNTTIRNSNGSVRASDIGGSLAVTNRFGSVDASEIRGSLSVTNTNGSIEAENVNGNASLNASFGSIEASRINGNLVAAGQNSRIEARTVGGNAAVATTFGNVEIVGVGGTAQVTNANGSVTLSTVGGDARVKTTFASVVLEDVRGAIDVQNQNGAISASGIARGACKPITLRTSFSPIKLSLSSAASYQVTARTTFGRISSDFPMTTSASSDEAVAGTIGSGGCRLELSNANGNITISRE